MANSIALAEKYLPLLDAKYQVEAKSSVLDADESLVRETQSAKTILIPKMTLQGLGDYSRATGYVQGDVTLEWETHTFSQDRGRTFSVDAYDDIETIGVAFGRLSGEFIRLHVAPELDAYRFSTYATAANTTVAADLASTTALQAIDTAVEELDNQEVPDEGRYCFVSPTMYKYLKQSDQIDRNIENVETFNGTVQREVERLDNGMQIIKVPQSRFYNSFDFYDGTTGGQEAGGFVPTPTTGKALNFLIVHETAVLQVVKTAMPRIFDPEVNQDANAWKFDYRVYHDAFVPDNKTVGIYAHTVA